MAGPLYKLSSRMLVNFGLLFVLMLAVVELAYVYGIPFSAFGGEFANQRSAVFNQLNLVADLKARYIKNWFEERKDDTKVIARSSMLHSELKEITALLRENAALGLEDEALRDKTMRSGPYNRLVQHLSLVKNTYTLYDSIHIVDVASKRIILSTDARHYGSAVSWDENVLRVMATGDFAIDFHHAHGMGRNENIIRIHFPVAYAGAPARKGAGIGYALGMIVNIDDFIRSVHLTAKGLGKTGEILLVNQEVRIITPLKHLIADGSAAEPLKYRIDSKPAMFAARSEGGLIEEDDYRGVPVLAAYRHIRLTSEMGLGLVVKRDISEVFAPLRRNIVYTTSVGLAVMLLSLFTTFIIARNIARPLKSVDRAARDIRSGSLEARADVVSDDEVGSVATTFNSMAEQIERWQDELERQVAARTSELSQEIIERKRVEADIQRWAKVFENAQWGVATGGSKDQTLELMNEAYARMHGYTIDELTGRQASDIYSPEDKWKMSDAMSVAREKGYHTFEVKRLRKDGSTFPSLNTITAIRDVDGKTMYFASNVLDITEHKRAEEAIKESQEQINLLLDSTAEGIYGLDSEGNCTMCNASCLSILGYKSEEDLIGRNMHELIHHTRPDGTEYPGVECKIYKALSDGTGMHCSDEVFWRADGSCFDSEYWSYPIKKNGKVIGAVVTFLDITERKHAEESLRKLTHALGERVKELKCQYNISRLDEKPGVSLDEIIQGVADYIPPGWHYPDITCARITINEKEYKTANFQETDWKQSSEINVQGAIIGSVTVCYLEQKPELDEGPFLKEERELIDTIAKNLGRTIDRKRAEETIRESEAQLKEAQKTASIGNWELDLTENKLTWSDEIYRIFEIDPEEFDASYETFLSAIHPDDRDMLNKAYTDSLKDKAPYEIVHRLLMSDGRVKHVHERCVTHYDADGNPVNSMGTVQDITERKLAEDEIRKLNEELEQRVRERTAQLEAANQELESFSYSVSHDLRAPLRSIDGFSHAIVKKYTGSMDDEAIDLFQRVRTATQRMAELINDMLELSRLSRAEMSMAEVDLTGLAREVVEDLRRIEPGRNVTFEITDGLATKGDRKLLHAVLENLMGNAWKFIFGKKSARIDFGSEAKDGRTVFFVRDNGAGFDMTYSDKLFVPFQRLHNVKEFPGTGVGLASVKRIISRHGGEVWAEGRVGQGSIFFFTLG